VFVPICSRVVRLGPVSPSKPIQIAREALPLAGQVRLGWVHLPWMQLKALLARAT
jgi:hypothetical protein